jgi:uncharacterized protein YbjT (DUF2867 family)
MRILVTGGTGRLGTAFVAAASRDGHRMRVLSRGGRPGDVTVDWARGDLATGDGIDTAVRGMDAVVHAASDLVTARATDVEGSRRLAEAAGSAGVAHLVYVSIVGIDRIPLEYYRRKLAAEEVIRAGPVPHTILRVAQFHAFVDLLLAGLARIPLVLPVPAGFEVQSISTEEVAEALLRVLSGPPLGRAPDLLGPEVLGVPDAARAWVRARRRRKLVVPVPAFGATARAFKRGYNTAPERPGGRETWQAWLERLPPA